MKLEWCELNEFGQPTVVKHPAIDLELARQHAKRNCRQCNGKGYLELNGGKGCYNLNAAPMSYIMTWRRLICDCAAKRLNAELNLEKSNASK